MKPVVVLGIGQSQFGKFPQRTIADLGSEAVRAALADAALERSQLQIAYSSRLYADMITGQTVFKEVGVTRIEMVNVENACAGGATAVRGLWKDIAAGYCDVGIALGVESMTTSPVAGKLIPPAKDDLDGMHGMTMPVMFSLQAKRLMHTHGATREDFAQVSVKAHDFGAVGAFEDVSGRPQLDGLRDVTGLFGHGQHDHPRGRLGLLQHPQELHTRVLAQQQIEQDDIRNEPCDIGRGDRDITGFADDIEAGSLEQCAHAFAHDDMVINEVQSRHVRCLPGKCWADGRSLKNAPGSWSDELLPALTNVAGRTCHSTASRAIRSCHLAR